MASKRLYVVEFVVDNGFGEYGQIQFMDFDEYCAKTTAKKLLNDECVIVAVYRKW